MPRSLDGKTKSKSLLDVTIAEAKRRVAAGEKFTTADQARLDAMNAADRQAINAWKERFRKRIEHFAPWFEWNDYSFARLSAELTKRFPNESMSSWLDLTEEELVGVIDACTPPKKPRKKQGDKPVTKWVRVHRHKYSSNKGAVRAYIEINGGTLAQLYEIDLKNDLKRNPLSKPE